VKDPIYFPLSSDLNIGRGKSKHCLLITSWMVSHMIYILCGKYVNVGNGSIRDFGKEEEHKNPHKVLKDGITHQIVFLIVFHTQFSA